MANIILRKKNDAINDCSFLRNIEIERLKFIREIEKKNNIFFVLIFTIGFLFFIINFFIQNTIFFFIYLFFLISLLLLLSFYFKNKKAEIERKYLLIFFKNLNFFIFYDNKNVNFEINTNYYNEDKKNFLNSDIFNDVFYFESQNSINFKINNFNVKLFDCIAQKKSLKKLEYLFIGKVLIIPNNYQFDNEIIIYIFDKNKKNNIFYSGNKNFTKILDDKNVNVFVKNVKKIPNNLINKIINIFVFNDILTNVLISVKKDKIYLCLSYASTCLLNPPLEQKFDSKPVIKFKNDLQKIINNLLDK